MSPDLLGCDDAWVRHRDHDLTDTTQWLMAAVAGGARDSSEIRAQAEAVGITAKALRRARESLGLETRRVGFGPRMRSLWSVPATSTAADHLPAVKGPMKAPSKPPNSAAIAVIVEHAIGGQAAAFEHAAPAFVAGLDQNEVRRHTARVAFFVGRGLVPDAATETATALVGRDRSMSREWGSCAECQRFYARDCGDAKPPEQVHPCWLRRSDAP